ncbi:hypothetical protein EIP91_011216 [Steccherinum ochraceum]|uniref:Kinetochore protein Sos7 coiled-coil domain-containing protein n=1 Tax=Steccherinum ochraceum TaxID=92696 RepID=A0A4R0R2E3_9APHY|nr:hypothetical protein EIP91_011216 [Steccherinum ochraceum]
MPATELSDPSAAVEAAQKLQAALENASLHIVKSQAEFDEHTASGAESSLDLPITHSEGSRLADPRLVSLDLAAQLAFFRKLKASYREQKTKDQYVKIILSDDAPDISADDNEKLNAVNAKKKEEVQEAKRKLAETYDNIKTFAPMVEEDYNKAKSRIEEATKLAQQVLDAKLQLIRLRQTHPHPRLTINAANAQLDAQVAEMQKLDDTLQQVNESVDRVKVSVKDVAKEVERLRVERAEVEKQAKVAQSEVEDGRVVGLYDWFTASLKLHRQLFSLESFTAPSENELRLIYSLESPNPTASNRRLTITLLFVPNTRRLADAQVEGLDADVGDVVAAHVQANDVSGLVAALLARARTEL